MVGKGIHHQLLFVQLGNGPSCAYLFIHDRLGYSWKIQFVVAFAYQPNAPATCYNFHLPPII